MSRPPSRRSGGRAAAGGGLGTFAGVFTPSVLTILGIILFLRLGFVVGGAGLGRALLIIGLANLSSVLTSFSLATIATNLRVILNQLPEAECLVVERINQLTHRLDFFSELLRILPKPLGGCIAGRQCRVNRIANQFSTSQRKIDTRGEDRIEKGKGIANQNKTVFRTMLRAIREFLGYKILNPEPLRMSGIFNRKNLKMTVIAPHNYEHLSVALV